MGADHPGSRPSSTATAASLGRLTDLWDHADLDEVRRECRAQIERAIFWGFDVSHLDAHLDALQLRPEFFDVYLELAVDFRLPLRLLGAEAEPIVGFPFRELAAEEDVLFADQFVHAAHRRRPGGLLDAVADLQPGITEITFRPAVDSDELRATGQTGTPGSPTTSARRRPGGRATRSTRPGVRLGYRPAPRPHADEPDFQG